MLLCRCCRLLQVEKVNKFTQLLVEKLRADLQKLTPKAAAAEKEKEAVKNALLEVRCAWRVLGVLRYLAPLLFAIMTPLGRRY